MNMDLENLLMQCAWKWDVDIKKLAWMENKSQRHRHVWKYDCIDERKQEDAPL